MIIWPRVGRIRAGHRGWTRAKSNMHAQVHVQVTIHGKNACDLLKILILRRVVRFNILLRLQNWDKVSQFRAKLRMHHPNWIENQAYVYEMSIIYYFQSVHMKQKLYFCKIILHLADLWQFMHHLTNSWQLLHPSALSRELLPPLISS